MTSRGARQVSSNRILVLVNWSSSRRPSLSGGCQADDREGSEGLPISSPNPSVSLGGGDVVREVPMGVGSGFGPVAKLELPEDVSDVRCHGLGADVQARGDLRVGQALAQEPEHLQLPLAELAEQLGPRSAAHTQPAQESRGGVGVPGGAQALEGLPGLTSLLDRPDRVAVGRQALGKRQVRTGGAMRHVQARKQIDGPFEVSGRAGIPHRRHDAAGGEIGFSLYSLSSRLPADLLEHLSSGGGTGMIALRELHVDEQSKERYGYEVVPAHLVQPSMEPSGSKGSLPTGKVERN